MAPVMSTTCDVPGYVGRRKSYLASRAASTKRPPSQCFPPVKKAEPRLGAVSDTSTSGMNDCAKADVCGPSSTFHDDGMSTLTMGSVRRSRLSSVD